MYLDPNPAGMLFQVVAVAATLVMAILLGFSRQIRASFVRINRAVRRSRKQHPQD